MASSLSTFAAPELNLPAEIIVDGDKINFTGTIVAVPCAVDVDNNTNIMLGQVSTNKLIKKGDSSSAVPFSIISHWLR